MSTIGHALRRRGIGLVAVGIALVGYYASGRLEAGLAYFAASGRHYSAGIGYAALTLGWDRWANTGGFPPRWFFHSVTYGFHADGAWRPYHGASAPWPAKSNYHRLIIPLWPVPAIAIGYVMFAHGVVRGTRAASMNRCQSCGYDLRGLSSEQGVCPECGVSLAGARGNRGIPGIRGSASASTRTH